MIEQTLKLLGKVNATPEQIIMLDGDGLEINIIRDGQRMTILNLRHYGADDGDHSVPVDPLPIQIVIERGSGQTGAPQFGGFQTG